MLFMCDIIMMEYHAVHIKYISNTINRYVPRVLLFLWCTSLGYGQYLVTYLVVTEHVNPNLLPSTRGIVYEKERYYMCSVRDAT